MAFSLYSLGCSDLKKNMNLFRKLFTRSKQKKTFNEYGYELKKFNVDGYGEIVYAQWKHPFEKPKTITKSNIDFYKRLMQEGAMVVDIGAHTGDTTVPMAVAAGPTGKVLALEPNKYVYKILEKNASLNTQLTRIVPLCFAATEKDDEFTFHYSDASFCNGGFLSQISNQNHRHNYTLQVKGRNLEKYLFENNYDDLPKLQLIKIDAEGYDKEILKTIPGIIRQYKPNVMIECYVKLTREERHELFDLIESYGYDLFYIKDFESFDSRILLRRENMMDRKHFEMLAMPR